MPTLYVHAGVHRTATSSIQKFLRDNDKVLLSKGYLYPFAVPRHAAQIKQMVTKKVSAADFAADLLRQIERETVPVHSVVLSDEDISSISNPEIFSGLQEKFDVKVVVSLRRQDLWLESWYLQNIKWQWNPNLAHLPFDDFLQRREHFFWIDYACHLTKYEKVFGQGSVLAMVFEKTEMPNGPIVALLNQLGITDLVGFGPLLNINSSLSPMMTEFMRHLPLDTINRLERAMFEKAFAAVDARIHSNGSKLLLSYDKRLEILADYAQSNRTVATRYFNRDSLFLEPVPYRDAPLADRTLPQSSQDLLAMMVAPMVQQLGEVMQAARLSRQNGKRSRQLEIRNL
ncbi:MAG: hypothetical protein RIR04_801 [Pseudomonadota bacterium]